MLRFNEIMGCCSTRPHGHGRNLASIVGWFVPSTLLLMVPKCPLCIVTYVGIVSGIGISVSTAAVLRVLLVTSCIGILVYGLARPLYRLSRTVAGPRTVTGGE